MSSDRQIAANQTNAQKSTGPRSKAGREVSRRNAHRHGLAIEIANDPAFQEDIERLSQTLSSGAQFAFTHARETAEAEVDLMRIRRVRAWLLETYHAALPDGLVELNKHLAKLERYERRAFSRRKRALRVMYESAAPIVGCSGEPGQRRRTMNASLHREIACAIIIDTSGSFLLQQRDDVVGILHPGKVSLFGGHREGSETFLECVVREIHEELSYFVQADQFQYLARLAGGDVDVDDGSLHAEFFIARDIPVERLVVTEGSLLIAEPDEIFKIEHKLTPSARFALKAYGVSGL